MFRPIAIARLCAAGCFLLSAAAAHADDAAGLLAKHKAFIGWQSGDGTVQTLKYDEEVIDEKGEVAATGKVMRLGVAYRAIGTTKKGLVTEDGFTGRVFWASNENGFTRQIVGDAQKARIAAEIFVTEATPQLTATLGSPQSIEGQTVEVLHATTPGDALDLYVDPQTGAYKRVVIDPKGTHETTIDVLGYSELAPGKKFIAKWKYHDSKSTHVYERFALNGALQPDELHPPQQSATWTFANPQPFKVTVTDKRVYVDAKVNGVPGRFILDTGAYDIALTDKFAQKAHVKQITTSQASGIGGTAKTRIHRADTFEIGGNTLSNVIVSSIDTEFESEAPDGLVGFDLFGGAVVKLSTANQTMTILDPATASVDRTQGVPAVVDLETLTPTFPMKINGTIDVNATLDSGNFYYVLFGHDLITHHGLRMLVDNTDAGYLQSHIGIGGVGGYDLGGCGHLDSVTLGPIVYQGAPACETSSFTGTDTLVGFDFFRNFDFVFDYPESLLIFIPHKQ